jgi:hypothetical protein
MSPAQHVFVAARTGVNHGGSIATALQLVDGAAAGADAVKLQSFRARQLAAVGAPRIACEREGPHASGGQPDMQPPRAVGRRRGGRIVHLDD